MKKPFVLNSRLNEIYRREQNQYMLRKLNKAKASVNSKCPESFNFYKNKFKKYQIRENLSKYYFSKEKKYS